MFGFGPIFHAIIKAGIGTQISVVENPLGSLSSQKISTSGDSEGRKSDTGQTFEVQ